jgi:hypothetical protein
MRILDVWIPDNWELTVISCKIHHTYKTYGSRVGNYKDGRLLDDMPRRPVNIYLSGGTRLFHLLLRRQKQ